MGKQLTTIALSSVLIVATLSAAASAQAVIENTGPGSTNVITIGNGGAQCDDEVCSEGDVCTVDNTTTIDLDVDVDQDADSGDATNNGNTTGGNATSGDATNNTTTDISIGIVNDSNQCVITDTDEPGTPTEPTEPTEPTKETDKDPQVLTTTDVNVGGGGIGELADTAGFNPTTVAATALSVIAVSAIATRTFLGFRSSN